ncbi:LysE family transporter [Parasalinivibrio latis]|uniref:LysE family translocator n=1 Tax=Parasalinivibrio latis TaxID=2952610 RepID=UPI0030DED45E
MVEIFAYAFGIMYTPGPVNLLSLGAGLSHPYRVLLPFCAGVALAMLFLFLLFGFGGALLIPESLRPVISLIGAGFIIYLAVKIIRSTVKTDTVRETDLPGFKFGFFMQLLNPKAPIAILPITTVQFPAANIEGMMIVVWSVSLALLAFGAPSSYVFLGTRLGNLIRSPLFFRVLNISLSMLLLMVATDILWQQVWMAWV